MESTQQKNIDLINNIKIGVLNTSGEYSLFYSFYEVCLNNDVVEIGKGKFDSFKANLNSLNLIKKKQEVIKTLELESIVLSAIEKVALAYRYNDSCIKAI